MIIIYRRGSGKVKSHLNIKAVVNCEKLQLPNNWYLHITRGRNNMECKTIGNGKSRYGKAFVNLSHRTISAIKKNN